MIPRLKDKYKKEIIKNLMSKLNYKNIHAIPRITKVVINMGLGPDASDKKKIEATVQILVLQMLEKLRPLKVILLIQ